eukprot:SAG11_NODE_990_length_6270_cov_38.630044_4_plen_105_part_00
MERGGGGPHSSGRVCFYLPCQFATSVASPSLVEVALNGTARYTFGGPREALLLYTVSTCSLAPAASTTSVVSALVTDRLPGSLKKKNIQLAQIKIPSDVSTVAH